MFTVAFMIDDKIQDYVVIDGISYFSGNFSSFFCETAYSVKQPEDSDVMEA